MESIKGFFTPKNSVLIVAIILFVIALIILIDYLRRQNINTYIAHPHTKLYFDEDTHNASESYEIPPSELRIPATNNQVVFSIWIYVDKWYNENNDVTRWRHILHKGTNISNLDSEEATWDTANTQFPGFWFSQENNNLRIILNTKKDWSTNAQIQSKRERGAPYENAVIQSVEDNGTYTIKFDKDDEIITGISIFNIRNRNQATDSSGAMTVKNANLNNLQEHNLEYIDLYNFPIKKWVNLIMTVEDRNVNIYINGKLMKTYVLTKFPAFNDSTMHFTNFGGFQGLLSYFRYIPKYLSAQQINGLYLHDKKKVANF
jgi:hypothetical protein